MTDEKRGRIAAALKALLNELGVELEWVNQAGGKALHEGDYHRVEEIAVRGKEIKAFSQKVADLHAEWEALSKDVDQLQQETPSCHPAWPSPPRKSVGTFREQYRVPMLQALVEMGGRARLREVLDRVHELIKDHFDEYDLEALRSGQVRWRSRASGIYHWMAENGLVRDDSPHGIWEISEAGRSFLADSQAGPRPASEQAQEGTGLAPNVQTSMDAYVLAILEALEDVGGTANTIDVLRSVGQTTKLQDSASECASLPGNALRFRHSMRGARAAMVRQGLLRADSPHGVWEITRAGRTLLAKARSDQ